MSHPLGDSEELVRIFNIIIDSFCREFESRNIPHSTGKYSYRMFLPENKSIRLIIVRNDHILIFGNKSIRNNFFIYMRNNHSSSEVIMSVLKKLFYKESLKKDAEIFMHTLNELSFRYI